MLQQTQVDRVVPKYEEFLIRFPSFAALAAASTANVIRVWAPLGYNRRAVNLHRLAREVVKHFDGTLPQETKALRSLPGVGAYTAAALACFAFGRAEPVVDTNVRRVLIRLEGAASATDREVSKLAAAYLPPARAGDWNQALMDLGSAVCRASSPACLLCPARAVCRSAGGWVREARAGYRAVPQERFEGSNRHLRGRIVDALRAAEAGLTPADLAQALALTGEGGLARLTTLIATLETDGLVNVELETDRVRLPE